MKRIVKRTAISTALSIIFLVALVVSSSAFFYLGFQSGIDSETETEYIYVYEYEIKEIAFSVDGNCEDIINEMITSANVSIHTMIYSFTLDSVGQTLITEYDSGTEIKIIFEKSQASQYSEYEVLLNYGVDVKLDTNSASMHHKVMIIDGYIVVTGSFNWSANAQNRNDENLIVIHSEEIAEYYEQEFQRLWSD